MEDEFESPKNLLETELNKMIYRAQICDAIGVNTVQGVITPAIEYVENTPLSDKIKALKPHFEWNPLDPGVKRKYRKDKNISDVFLREAGGNNEEGAFIEAMGFYNMAILFAEKDGLELIYAARATAILTFRRAQEEKRSERSSASTSTTSASSSSSTPTPGSPRESKEIGLRARTLFYRNMFSLSFPNQAAPSLPISVDIDWNQSHPRGRRLVAKTNIAVGSTVLLERPFAAVLTDALAWDVDHCHHCLSSRIEGFPCDDCVFTLYCSAHCREKARGYHQYECVCFPELHCALDDVLWKSKFHLAFKLVCLLGPKALFTQFKQRKPGDPVGTFVSVQRQTHIIPGMDTGTGVPESDSNMAHKLMSLNIPEKGHYFILAALTLARTLLETHFSEAVPYNNKAEEEPEFQDFLAEVILCHFEVFRINALALHDFPEYGRKTLRTQKSSTKGLFENIENSVTGAYVTASLVNHSCVENVAIINGKKDGLMAMIAIKPIVPGEELFISYNGLYNSEPFMEEWDCRMALITYFNFQCDCIACENNWPPINELIENDLSLSVDFCCQKCSSTFQYEKKASSEFLRCKLVGAGNVKCGACGAPYTLSAQRDEYMKMKERLGKYKATFQNKEPPTKYYVTSAPNRIREAVMFFETSVCPPNYSCFLASELYKDFVNLTLMYVDPIFT